MKVDSLSPVYVRHYSATPGLLTRVIRNKRGHVLSRNRQLMVPKDRKRNGSAHPANTLHHICCGLMWHLRQSGQPEIDFFKDPASLSSGFP